jgi:two-component system, chemotaxis family, sensor kinase CheA
MAHSISIGTKLALSISGVLAIVAIAAGLELVENSREQLVEGKRTATTMVVDLFAASVAPALDFGDVDSMQTEVEKLAANPDVDQASLWDASDSTPVVKYSRRAERAIVVRPMEASTVVGPEAIRLARTLTAPDGTPLGSLVVVFSLAPENARFAESRVRILGLTGLFAVLTGLIMVALSRRIVVTPIMDLARAARKLEQGEWRDVAVKSGDELGRLGTAFNAMASAIVEREQRLAELNGRLQELLDHMRQAIVVFDASGTLDAVRSRQAEVLFEGATSESVRVQDLLYPNEEGSVDAVAFEEWISVAFSMPPDAWEEVAELAPREVVVGLQGGGERTLALDFRPIRENGSLMRVMMLATDETEKRRLERAVKAQDEEHGRQMAAMRRLVAGGGQLLVTVLDRARERLLHCEGLVGGDGGKLELGLVEQLFQHAHSVKGEARAFDLVVLEAEAAELEDYLAILRGRLREHQDLRIEDVREAIAARTGATRQAVDAAAEMLVRASPIGAAILEQVTVQRRDVVSLLELAGDRDDDLGRAISRVASRPFGESLLGLLDSVPRWAEREDKRVRVEVEGRDVLIPPDLARVLPDVLTHLVRNALAHGIETGLERKELGKHEVGVIVAECRASQRGPIIVVADDGGGVDTDQVLAARRVLSPREGEWDERSERGRVLDYLFEDGLTTAESARPLAGRGVGLGAVRADLASIGYAVRMESSQGRGTRVVIEPSESRTSYMKAILKESKS